jgi:acyl-CoA thioester hydrolase
VSEAADIDELGHVSNLVYLRRVLDVAMAHTRARGWDYEQYRALGAIFMVRRHEIDYIAQVTLGQIRDSLPPRSIARCCMAGLLMPRKGS